MSPNANTSNPAKRGEISRATKNHPGKMPAQQAQVPAVRLVADVEQVANHRHEADERVEAEVAEHAREHPARRSKPPGRLDDLAAGRAGCGIADPGDEADDAVGPEPEARARQPVALVEPIGETLDPLQRCPGLRTDARCRRPPMARLGARRSMAHAGCQYREKTAGRRWHAGCKDADWVRSWLRGGRMLAQAGPGNDGVRASVPARARRPALAGEPGFCLLSSQLSWSEREASHEHQRRSEPAGGRP
jgi:hypothetical protein